jgi:hypothetical protein
LIWLIVFVVVCAAMYYIYQESEYGQAAKRIRERRERGETPGWDLAKALFTAYISSNKETQQKINSGLKTVATVVLPKETIKNHAEKMESLNKITVNSKATETGLPVEYYAPVRQKAILDDIELERAERATGLAIRAGLEVNAEVHRRKQQISRQIEDCERDLERAQSKIVKDGIRRTIKNLKEEYDGLGRDTV